MMPLILFAVLQILSLLSVPVSALVAGVRVLLTAMPAGAAASTLLSIPAILIWSIVLE